MSDKTWQMWWLRETGRMDYGNPLTLPDAFLMAMHPQLLWPGESTGVHHIQRQHPPMLVRIGIQGIKNGELIKARPHAR